MLDTELIKSKAKTDFLSGCAEDFRELWGLLWTIRYHWCDGDYPVDVYARTDPQVVREIALEIIRETVESGLLDVYFTNYPASDRYKLQKSTFAPADTYARIVSEWDRLPHEPRMGEIAVFRAANFKESNAR